MRKTKLFALLTAICIATSAPSQATTSTPSNAPQAYTAITTKDAKVAPEVLGHMLNPLTAEQLQVECEAWMQLLIAVNQRMSANEIMSLQTTDKTDTLTAGLTTLREQRTQIVMRFEAVTEALENRGGDPKRFADYITASTASELSFNFIQEWLASPEGGRRFGWNIIKFLITLLVFKVASSIVAGIVRQAVNRLKKASDLLRDFVINVVRRVTFFIGLIVALSMIEVDITPFIAALGAAGFIIGFALQGTLSNFASGLMILIYRPYDIGEVVTAADITGKVDAMTLVSTTLRLPDNQTVIIPNNSIWGNVITNVTGQTTRRVDMTFGCGYDDDLQKVQDLLLAIVTSHPKVHAAPEPLVRVHELADSSINFIVRPWTDTSDYWEVFWDITRTVKDRFDAEGLSIPFPQRDVHIHQVTT